jgi:hypothetical protein
VNNVKIINITNGAFAVLLLASSMVGAETQYPASDFQPKVVYQDPDYKSTQSSTSTASSAPATSSVTDSKYPAANFQPKVVYNDPDYKHTQSSTSAPGVSEAATESVADKKEESGSNYLIGLVVLAVVGVVLFRKKPQAGDQGSKSSYRASAGGATGVAKYINRKSGTGVSRYLEKNVKSAVSSAAATGVAKYMAKQVETAKTTATEAATGVEKYMRNRG